MIEHNVNQENRYLGKYIYDPTKDKNLTKSIYFYVKEDEAKTAQYSDIQIKLSFTGIGDDPAKNVVALDAVRLTYLGDAPFVLDEKDETTTAKDLREATREWIPVYLNRVFSNNAWNAFVCPVPLNVGQVVGAFGDEVQVSEISKSGLDPNYPLRIVFNKIDIEVPALDDPHYTEKAEAPVIWPGHFYLVKPSKVNETNALKKVNVELAKFEDMPTGHYVFLGSHNLSYSPYVWQYEEDPEPVTEISGELLPKPSGDEYATSPYLDGDPIKSAKEYLQSELLDVTDTAVPDNLKGSPYRRFQTKRYGANHQNADGDDEDPQGKPHNEIKLVGSYVPQKFEDRGNTYIFSTQEGVTRLVHLSGSTTQTNAPQGLNGFRFYIQDISGESGAKSFSFITDGVEDEDEATEIINTLIDDDVDGDIYNIAGQKVTGKLPKGAYVRNGKKFLVK